MHLPDDRNLRIHVPRHRYWVFHDAAVLVVLHHPDNPHAEIDDTFRRDDMPERVLIGQEAFRELLIDDPYPRRTRGIGFYEIATREHRNAQRVKEIRSHHVAAHRSRTTSRNLRELAV